MSTLLTKSRKNKVTSKVTGSRTWFITIIIMGVITAIAVFFVVSQVTSQSTYYVLNQDVPAKTQITASMLKPVSASSSGIPRNTLDINYVTTDSVYSKIALDAGDTVTLSNTGPSTPITLGIPENFVVASFVAPAETSVAGKLKRGDYIDLIATTPGDNPIAKIALQHVLILDATNDGSAAGEEVGADESVDTAASESIKVRTGIPTTYTVGLSPQDAAKLAVISELKIFVVLSASTTPNQSDVSAAQGEVLAPGAVSDSGLGTDNTFTPKKEAKPADKKEATQEEATDTPTP